MKILHIISQTPDFTGSGKFIRAIIRQSSGRGHENFLVAGAQKKFVLPSSLIEEERTVFVRFPSKELDFAIPGMSDVMPYESSVFSRMAKEAIASYQDIFKEKIKKAVLKFKPDILHTHHLWLVSAAARTAAPDIPMVVTCHGTCLRQHRLCPDLGRQIIEPLRSADQVIALNRHQKQQIMQDIGIDAQKIQVISGGFNSSRFYHAPKPFSTTVEMLYAGKFSAAKGVPWLLKSMYRLTHLPVRLHLAGSSSGPEKKKCFDLAEGLKEKVVIHGPLSHEKLSDLMRKCHVFVLPSFYEGLPLVLVEALACGCRIVSTRLPGVEELFAGGHWDMIRLLDLPVLKTVDRPYKKDEENLIEKLASALAQTAEKVAADPEPDTSYIRSASEFYAWEKIFMRMEKVYKNIVSL